MLKQKSDIEKCRMLSSSVGNVMLCRAHRVTSGGCVLTRNTTLYPHNTKPCPPKCANTSGGEVLITGSAPEGDQEALVLISLAASCFKQATEERKQAFEKLCVQNIQSQIKREEKRFPSLPSSSVSPLTHKAVGEAGLEQKTCAVSR